MTATGHGGFETFSDWTEISTSGNRLVETLTFFPWNPTVSLALRIVMTLPCVQAYRGGRFVLSFQPCTLPPILPILGVREVAAKAVHLFRRVSQALQSVSPLAVPVRAYHSVRFDKSRSHSSHLIQTRFWPSVRVLQKRHGPCPRRPRLRPCYHAI